MTELDAAGAVIRTCDSGAMTFRLANSNVFGGTTAQRNFVFARISATGKRLLRLQ